MIGEFFKRVSQAMHQFACNMKKINEDLALSLDLAAEPEILGFDPTPEPDKTNETATIQEQAEALAKMAAREAELEEEAKARAECIKAKRNREKNNWRKLHNMPMIRKRSLCCIKPDKECVKTWEFIFKI